SRRSSVAPSAAKTWNLRLDEPALTTRMVSMASRRRQDRGAPPGIGTEDRDRAGRHPGAYGISTRGENDRYARAEHQSGRVGPCQEGEILRQHVPGFEVGYDQDLRPAGDWRVDALDLRRLRIDRIVERERPVQDAAGDLASLGHLAERCCLDGRRD